MSISNINVGTIPNDGLGDFIRTAFIKVNDNFTYVDSVKVDKINGWGLSENNFSPTYKSQLDNLQASLALKNELIAHLKFNNADKTIWNNGYSNVTTATSYGEGAGRLASGGNWTANGSQAGYSNTTGGNWTANGSQAGYSNTTGSNWTANGFQAGYYNTTGSNWTANGSLAGYSSTTGGNWTANGFRAGVYLANGISPLLTLNNGVFIGADTKALVDNSINEIVIGYNATGLGSNSSVIGNSSTLRSRIWGRFLSGTSVDDGVNQGQFNGTISAQPATTANQVPTWGQVQAIARPYKVYTSIINQTLHNTVSVLFTVENTIGNIIWSRVSAGVYEGTLAGAFAANNKTIAFVSNNFNGINATNGLYIQCKKITSDKVEIRTLAGNSLTDGVITGATLEIRVYN